MEARELPKKESHTLLCVFCAEEHVPPFDRILCHETIRTKFQDKLQVRLSTYENFLEEKYEDTYDFVMLIYMDEVTSDDLEAQQDHYLFYAQVPVVHYVVANKVYESECYDGVRGFVKDHLEQRLVDGSPIVLGDSVAAAAEALAQGFDLIIDAYTAKRETEVRQAFDQFDQDGNGTIDAEELQILSRQLGHPLSEEELKTALRDLDLNHDGVIDFDEFCRWYFTGMRPFNGTTRSMLQLGSRTGTVFDALARERLAEIVRADRSLSKHRLGLAFNEPAEAYVAQMALHFCGPVSEGLAHNAAGFRELLGSDLKEEVGRKYMNEYFELKIQMKPGSKYKQHLKAVEEVFAPGGALHSAKAGTHVRFFPMDKELIVRFYLSIQTSAAPEIPDTIREALKDIDQYFKFKAVVGIDAEELLTSDKPLVEHLTKGFKMEYELVFLRNLKQALLEGLEGAAAAEVLTAMGPAFALSSNSSVDLTFDDFDEVREHPMADQLLISLQQVIEGAFGKKVEDMLRFTPDLSSVGKGELAQHLKRSEYAKEKMKHLDLYKAVASLLKEFAADFRATVDASLFGFMAVKYELHGAGYGDLALLLFNCLTMGAQERTARALISDLNDAKAEAK